MRAMLCGDHYAAKQSQYELDSAVRTLVANGDKAAARYVYVLYNMLEHKLVDEADTLEVGVAWLTTRRTHTVEKNSRKHRSSTKRPCTVCGPLWRTAGGV